MDVRKTSLPGVLLIDLDLHVDPRGSFREAWQNERMVKLGLPEIKPVQCNVAHSSRGVIRGIHAEPWDKYIHIAYGTVFAAIVDLRENQPSFGQKETFVLSETTALYVPHGFGNSYQVTSPEAVYTYLVTAHWQVNEVYPAIAFDDPDLAIEWPITGAEQIISEKDRKNPRLKEVFP